MKFLIVVALVFCATAHAGIIYKGPSGIITKRGPIGPDGRGPGVLWDSSEESVESGESIESAESPESIESAEDSQSSESWEHRQWNKVWRKDNNVIINGPGRVVTTKESTGDNGQWSGKRAWANNNGLWKNDNGIWKGDNGSWKSDTGSWKSSWGGNNGKYSGSDGSWKGKGGWQ